MKLDPETIDVSIEELEKLVERAGQQTLADHERRQLRAAVETLGQLARMLADKDATLRQLRKMLLKPATTEKTRAVLERAGIEPDAGEPVKPAGEKKKRQGHGRNPARAYEGARKVKVTHPEMKPGDRCPECVKAVYELGNCVVTCAGKCTSRRHRRKWARKSATRRRRAWWRY